MKRSTFFLPVALASVFAFPAFATADVDIHQQAPEEDDQQWLINLHAGVASPLGGFAGYGIELERELNDWFSLSGGVGLDMVGNNPQFAAMTRYRVEQGPLTAGIGLGVSHGVTDDLTFELFDAIGQLFGAEELPGDGEVRATWANGELYSSLRLGQVDLRAYAGVRHTLFLMGNEEGYSGDGIVPYFGLAAGWAF